eukprot:scaffold50864_cov40-Prasinocladus_malaysianus.AAC.1
MCRIGKSHNVPCQICQLAVCDSELAVEARSAAVAARAANRQLQPYSCALQSLPTAARQAILERIAVALENSEEEILAANKKDIELSEAS